MAFSGGGTLYSPSQLENEHHGDALPPWRRTDSNSVAHSSKGIPLQAEHPPTAAAAPPSSSQPARRRRFDVRSLISAAAVKAPEANASLTQREGSEGQSGAAEAGRGKDWELPEDEKFSAGEFQSARSLGSRSAAGNPAASGGGRGLFYSNLPSPSVMSVSDAGGEEELLEEAQPLSGGRRQGSASPQRTTHAACVDATLLRAVAKLQQQRLCLNCKEPLLPERAGSRTNNGSNNGNNGVSTSSALMVKCILKEAFLNTSLPFLPLSHPLSRHRATALNARRVCLYCPFASSLVVRYQPLVLSCCRSSLTHA
ncbi:hypothetical protein cyc_04685 [Cyclospora cayetanensis]|uniref:Uncharacterized protein n=1 Tax=Cyclospora cayetanensis TaxID=88456 RepID=A0A1D3CRF6_9EIME|nr:hypothetical protein cyc_04685 [Cyclospora cayetanensis]